MYVVIAVITINIIIIIIIITPVVNDKMFARKYTHNKMC